MAGTVWAQRMWTRPSETRVGERAYSHLIIQHFQRKWTLIIWNCHSGPTEKAKSFRCLCKHPLMRNKRFTVSQQWPRFLLGDAAAEYFRRKSIKWSYWHKTRASLWTDSQCEQNDKSLKNRHQYLSSSHSSGGSLALKRVFVNSQQSLFMAALQKGCQMGYFGAEWH